MPDSHLQVGAPDPERKTSPIIDDDEKEDLWVREGELRTDRLGGS